MPKLCFYFFALILFFSCESYEGTPGEPISVIPVEADSVYCFVTPKGKIMVDNAYFSEISTFRSGLAIARRMNEDTYGFVDSDGEFLISPVYEQATYFQDGLAWAVRDGQAPCAINTKGEMKFSLIRAQRAKVFSEGLAAYRDKNGLWGYVDVTGNVVLSPQYEEANSFVNGRAAVKKKNGLWNYIDKTGKELLGASYYSASDFTSHKLAVVKGKEHYGVVSESGDTIVPFTYESIVPDRENFLVKKEDAYFWISKQNEKLNSHSYENASLFLSADIAPVCIDGRWGYVNKKGEIKIVRQFDIAYPFSGKYAVVAVGGRYGVIDRDGCYVTNPMFSNVATDYLALLMGTPGDFSMVRSGK